MTLSAALQNSILAALGNIDSLVDQDLSGPGNAKAQLLSLTLDMVPTTQMDGRERSQSSPFAIDRKTRSLIFVSGTIDMARIGAQSEREPAQALRVSAVFLQSG